MQIAAVYPVCALKIKLSGVVYIHAIAVGLRPNILGFHSGGGVVS
jgi:hypothetical protein